MIGVPVFRASQVTFALSVAAAPVREMSGHESEEEADCQQSSLPTSIDPQRHAVRSAASPSEQASSSPSRRPSLSPKAFLSKLLKPFHPSHHTPIIPSRMEGLPPKTTKEEARHQKELARLRKLTQKRMTEEGLEKIADREEARKRELVIQDGIQFWAHAMDNWEEFRRRRAKEVRLWLRRGIPSSCRGVVWSRLVGNSLQVTPALYADLTRKATTFIAETASMSIRESVHTIDLDLERTFPDLRFFQKSLPMHDSLRRMLASYALFRNDIGYVQSMSYIAALLLLNMPEFDAFVAFANILEGSYLRSLLRMEASEIQEFVRSFAEVLRLVDADLSRRLFVELGIVPELFIMEWAMTMFSRTLPVDLAVRIWDCLLFFGTTDYVVRTAVAILRFRKAMIMTQAFDEVMVMLNHLDENLKPSEWEELLETIHETRLPRKAL